MTFEYEFLGPIGTFVCTVATPIVLYGLTALSNSNGCLSLYPLRVPGLVRDAQLMSWRGVTIVYAWMFAQLLLHKVMPAVQKEGVLEPNNTRWRYRLNGFPNLCVTYISIFVLAFYTPYLPLYWVADHFVELLTGALVFSISLSVTLYAASFRSSAVLAASGTSGCPAYDFWMGRELNPRVFNIDLKEFCELQPGLTGWIIINLAFAHHQYVNTGQVSLAMFMINIFQLVYVADSVWNETSILTTMDITSEGFGYMLAFGDLCWVPFAYSLQARYIAEQNVHLAWPFALAILALKVVGYTAFRGANSQKDAFRRDPQSPAVAHLKTMPTKRGTKLIYSGWWGVARHINYTGDWLMGLAWCLTSGTDCIIPYFYVFYFAALLLHRERRDDHNCRIKYGTDWDEYCKLVPYRLIPRVY